MFSAWCGGPCRYDILNDPHCYAEDRITRDVTSGISAHAANAADCVGTPAEVVLRLACQPSATEIQEFNALRVGGKGYREPGSYACATVFPSGDMFMLCSNLSPRALLLLVMELRREEC